MLTIQVLNTCVCRCRERLKVKTDGSTNPVYTGLFGELEHLKIETRLRVESFGCVTCECDLELSGCRCTVDIPRQSTSLTRMLSTLGLRSEENGGLRGLGLFLTRQFCDSLKLYVST